MATKPKPRHLVLLDYYRFFLGLGIVENILAAWYLFSIPSKTQRGLLAGFSLQRLGAGFVLFVLVGIYIFLLIDSSRSRGLIRSFGSKLQGILNHGIYRLIIKSSLIIIVVSSLASSLSFLFFDFTRLLFFIPKAYLLVDIGTLAAILVGWVFLASLKLLILFSISGTQASQPLSMPVRLMVISWTLGIFVILFFGLWSWPMHKVDWEILQGPGLKILILAIWFSVWAFLDRREGWVRRHSLLFACISIWLCVFMPSLQAAQSFDRLVSPNTNYFNQVAYAFLHRKLYLINPLSTGDIAFFNGHWYVPNPPFPAILMLPFIAVLGMQAFNTTTFSLILGATSAVIIYLILHQMIHLGWTKLSHTGAAWLTALFSFGTMYWWLSMDSRVWFFAQVVTVLCSGLAFLSVLRKWSPWLTGFFLVCAILSRPNVFVLWPALLAIAIQLSLDSEGKLDWKESVKWGLFSAIPVVIGVGLLLTLNYVRFGNFLDFQYGNLNGAGQILEDVKNYGLFSPHFLSRNLYFMLVAPPPLSAECGYYLTRGWGMSLFATTPAVIYVFRRFKISWWTVGSWVSILLSVIVLGMYSNNGALQYGYRYLLDFIFPVIMLIAYNADGKISAPLKTLIIASIIINYYGTISWFKGPC